MKDSFHEIVNWEDSNPVKPEKLIEPREVAGTARSMYSILPPAWGEVVAYFFHSRAITFSRIVNTSDTKIEVASGK